MTCVDFLGRDILTPFYSMGNRDRDVATAPDVELDLNADVDADSTSREDVWRSYTHIQPEAPAKNRHMRRRRSRSSPVRFSENQRRTKVRARSPSAMSPRRANERTRAQPTAEPGIYAPEYALNSNSTSEDYLQPETSYWCRPGSTNGSAYFSFLPPVAPLRLVPIVTPSQPPLPPLMLTGLMDIARGSYAKESTSQSEDTVRSILLELVEDLPLLTVRTASTPGSLSEQTHNSDFEEPRQTASSASHSDSNKELMIKRSIATQAKSMQDDEISDGIKKVKYMGNENEWLGGVRALRDSHVRLVLRQLRHIERLNRALDRASRPIPTSPSVHAQI